MVRRVTLSIVGPKFKLGHLVWTCGVNDEIADDERFASFVMESIQRHTAGDWGDLCAEDKTLNDTSLKDGSRLLSAYEREGLRKIWIITEADRAATTVLFPEEY